jgi:hypothetical protein
MIARSESEFNLFNRMDIARREYESHHGVGSGGDGANERRAWKLPNTTDQTKSTSRIKRKKESDNEDSIDQSTKTKYRQNFFVVVCYLKFSSSKISTSFIDHSDDEITGEGISAIGGDETTPSLLDDLDDEEDVDFTQETSRIHRKMKTNRLITEDELPDWLKNDVDEVEKTLEKDEDFGKGRRQRKDIDYSDNLTEREFLQALEEGNLDDAVEQKRQRKQNRRNPLSLQEDEIDLDETEACSSFDNPPSNQQNNSFKRGSVKKRLETVDPNIAPQCRLLLDHLLAYRTEDNRQLAQVFIRLPGQKQLPLYYQIIKEPIDFQRIRRKIDTYRYSNLEQLHSDMKLLVENAQTFNCETSIIYSDSILLDKVYQDLCQQLQSGLLQAPKETTTTTTTTTSRNSTRRERTTRTKKSSVKNNNETSRRGRKRKESVAEEESSIDEPTVSIDSDNQEN